MQCPLKAALATRTPRTRGCYCGDLRGWAITGEPVVLEWAAFHSHLTMGTAPDVSNGKTTVHGEFKREAVRLLERGDKPVTHASRHAIDLNPSFAEGHVGLAHGWQAHALDAPPPCGLAPSLAVVYNAMGDTGAALDPLQRAKAGHDIRIGFIKVYGPWNLLRGEPRLKALRQELGLSEVRAQGRH